ncbi:MAG TPA: ATP-binding protein, partial [Gemmatimonadaceae bacterium]|nr:ATP-binding protein [Gemmatimonadaceae bacterium]
IGTVMPDGNLLAMIRDTTERNRTESRLRRLVESNAQGVLFWNSIGRVTGANDAFLRIVGYSRAELAAGDLHWGKMTPPEFAASDERVLGELRASGVCTPYEKEFFHKDGSRVPVLVGAATFEEDPDEGVCFVLDLTERKKLERQFLRAQRMESIGTLAGGIAHDLNNVFAPILLSVELLRAEIKDATLSAVLDTLNDSAQHGAQLVKQVLSFARGVEGRHVVVNPLHIVREVLKVMRTTFPKSIDVQFVPSYEPWTVTGDPTQIHQVLLNLCVNARDAMPDGGTLAVVMGNVVLDETYVAMNPDSRAGPYVMVSVRDTGVGIPPDVRERMFEPFFTTKEIGQGTGLGLSTSLAIVKSHGGLIHAYSEMGHGTTFKVYLPAHEAETPGNRAVTDQVRLPRGNGEMILIVDDEKAVRTVTGITLERFGYRVMLAANGAEALALFAQHRSEIAAVLTDMAMPVMDGPATIVALKSLDPKVKIIGSSGMTSSDGVARALNAGVDYFVHKPYTAETMLETLEKLLRGI